MAAAFRDSGTIGNGATATTTSGNFTIPAGAVAGDVAVLHYITSASAVADSWTGLGAWTLLSGPDSSGAGALTNGWVFAMTLAAGDLGSTVTATYSTARKITGTVTVVSGVDLSTATIALLTSSSATTTDTLPTLASVPAGAMVLGIFGRRGPNTSSLAALTVPPAYTAGPVSRSSYSTAGNNESAVGYLVAGSAGTYGGESTTSSDSTTGQDYVLAMAASSSGGSSSASGTLTLSGSGTATVGASATGAVTLSGVASPGLGSAFAAGAVTLTGTGTARALTVARGGVDLGGTANATVPIPPLPPIGVVGAPRWSWALGPWTTLPQQELPNALARSLKLRLIGTSEASFTVDGNTDDAAAVQELVSDLWVMRNGFTLFRGRFGPSSDDMDGTRHTCQFTVGDYRAVLQRRILFDGDLLTYTNNRAFDIAFNLLATTLNRSGGDLNIGFGAHDVGPIRTITYPAGQSIGQAIEQLSLMDGGFNWDIVPQTGSVRQFFTTWTSRGINRGKVLDYPGRLVKAARSVDPGAYANAIRETGNTGLAAVRAEATDIATRPEGRWESQAGDTSLLDAASVTARANYDLAQSQQVVPTWTVTMRPGAWGGPTDLWLGDVVNLQVNSGRLAANDFLRVYEIAIDLDDADNETVTLTLAALDPFKRRRLRDYSFRLSQLERR